MIALLKIHCPHCGVAGQVLMPPPGTIIIGPCPECSNLVVIFAGEALPLNTELMNTGTIREKYEHVLHVLSTYLEKQVRQCFSQTDANLTEKANETGENPEELHPITEVEIQRFVDKELKELDTPEFFKNFG